MNRPFASTVIIDYSAENAFPAPNNYLILPEWDGEDLQETKLLQMLELLDFIAKKVVSKTPANEICPFFHSIEKDAVNVWKDKTSSIFGKPRH